MQSEPAPMDRIRIPRDPVHQQMHGSEGTPPAARHIGHRMDNGLAMREREGDPAGIVKKAGGANSAHRP